MLVWEMVSTGSLLMEKFGKLFSSEYTISGRSTVIFSGTMAEKSRFARGCTASGP